MDDTDDAARQAFGYEPMPPIASVPAPPVASAHALAGWWPRAAALVLDGLVVMAVAMVVVVAAILLTGDSDERTIEIVVYAVAFPLGLAYAPLLMIRGGTRNGQTLGKQAMGLRVVRENGRPVTLGNALLREIVGRQLLAAITFNVYSLVDYLGPIWDKKNQCLHDKVADTLVVRTDDARPSAAGEQPIGSWLPPQSGA